MRPAWIFAVLVSLVAACGGSDNSATNSGSSGSLTRVEQQSPAPFFDFARYGTWSPPVLIDDPASWRVNTACREQGPALSANGRVLYFASMRVSNNPSDGCKADFDIWVSQRACRRCAWEAPARLDVVISAENDATAAPSPDG